MKLKNYFSRYRKVERIRIGIRNQTFGFHAEVQESEIVLLADDEADIVIPCVSHACSGSSGYSVSTIIAEALGSDDGHITGRIDCNGREHAKAGALSCSGRLYYDAQVTFCEAES